MRCKSLCLFVKNRIELYSVHKMAETYGVRPSSFLDLRSPYTKYCLDSAAYTWGSYLEAELSEYRESLSHKKDQRSVQGLLHTRWQQLLGVDSKGAQVFASPTSMKNGA